MASWTRDLDSDAGQLLLTDDDPLPVQIINPAGRSSFLLIGDHAGNRIPDRLHALGLEDDDLRRHIGWDIGVAALGEALAPLLDATFIRQTYSRLVIDCNRAPDAHDAMPLISDRTTIPGNTELTPTDRAARVGSIHAPYQDAIADALRRRDAAGIRTVLVSLHSFTPMMGSVARPWQIGILHGDGDDRFALACLEALRARAAFCVGDNEPYRMDSIDYTVPRHAFAAGRPYVEIEIRQDLLGDRAGIDRWTGEVIAMLDRAIEATG